MKPTDLLKSAAQKSAQAITATSSDGVSPGSVGAPARPPMSLDTAGPVIGRAPALPGGKSLEDQVAFGNTLKVTEPKAPAAVAAGGPAIKVPPPPPVDEEPAGPDEAELAKITEAAKPTPGPEDLRGTGKGPDRTIFPEDIAKQKAYEAQKAQDAAADASARSAVASRVGGAMDPNAEVAANPPTGGTPGTEPPPAAAAADPGVMERVQNWVQDPANRPYLYGAAGLTAAGALAYLLTREEEPKKRRRAAMA